MEQVEFPKKYKANEVEEKWQKFWQENDIYAFDPKSEKESFVVDTPPPTMSGAMHIGHFGSYTQQDFYVRYQRQLGKNVLGPFGTDDNGIPTERLVEKKKKVSSSRLPRQEFIKICNDYIQETRPEFTNGWIKAGMSCDFKSAYSTIDPYCQKQSQRSFIELFQKDKIYQKVAPAVWCPHCITAISQAEMEDEEKDSTFNDIIFRVEGKEDLIIGTTRPELIFACVALFVNPEDDRYKDYIGEKAIVPIFEHQVPIIADESAQIDKGTGVLMICTYGDYSDVEAAMRHNLDAIDSITQYGKLTENAKEFAGLKISVAREKILEKLEEKKLLVNQKPIRHIVNVHERCGTPIEFYTHKQWFVRVKDEREELLEQGDKINWYPNFMKNRFKTWVEGLQWDWCISRQRHFGVPFPVWYSKKTGEVILPDLDQLPVDPLVDKPNQLPPGHTLEDIEPETDVLDTWATSSVTPLIISKYQEDESFFEKTFQNSVRPQAHDIIRTWAFYTIVKAYYQTGNVPWNDIVISGHVLDKDGKKMSKSKGNTVDPIDAINKHGCDSLRYWSATAQLGQDIRFKEDEIKAGSRVINKLWNASKFSLMMLEDFEEKVTVQTNMDKWLTTKFEKMLKAFNSAMSKYDFFKAKLELERFFMDTYCDNYLEIAKDRLYKPDIYGVAAKQSAQYTMNFVLNGVLKCFAPFVPHITEEIFSYYYLGKENVKSIHLSSMPVIKEEMIDEYAELSGDLAVDVLRTVRQLKQKQQKSLAAPIQNLVIKFVDEENEKKYKSHIETVIEDIKASTKAETVSFAGDVTESSDKFNLEIGVIFSEEEKK